MAGVTAGSGRLSPQEVAIERLRASALSLVDTAEREGIETDGALGTWVRAEQTVLLGLADAMEGLHEGTHRAIDNVRELAVAEVQALRQATELAVRTVESLRAEKQVLEVKAQVAVSAFMATATPQLAQALERVAVIKERGWNRRRNLAGVAIAALVLVSVFGAGMVTGGGDFQAKSPGRAALAAVSRCRAAAQPDRIGGQAWCPVKSLDEPSQ